MTLVRDRCLCFQCSSSLHCTPRYLYSCRAVRRQSQSQPTCIHRNPMSISPSIRHHCSLYRAYSLVGTKPLGPSAFGQAAGKPLHHARLLQSSAVEWFVTWLWTKKFTGKLSIYLNPCIFNNNFFRTSSVTLRKHTHIYTFFRCF